MSDISGKNSIPKLVQLKDLNPTLCTNYSPTNKMVILKLSLRKTFMLLVNIQLLEICSISTTMKSTPPHDHLAWRDQLEECILSCPSFIAALHHKELYRVHPTQFKRCPAMKTWKLAERKWKWILLELHMNDIFKGSLSNSPKTSWAAFMKFEIEIGAWKSSVNIWRLIMGISKIRKEVLVLASNYCLQVHLDARNQSHHRLSSLSEVWHWNRVHDKVILRANFPLNLGLWMADQYFRVWTGVWGNIH